MARHWRHRRAEVVAMGEERGFEVLTTEEEWEDACGGCQYTPKFKCLKCEEEVTSTAVVKCLKCEEEVTSTAVVSLYSGQGIGCRCNLTMARHWRHRLAEVVAMGEERGFKVLTTEEEWEDACDGCQYTPKFKCLKCEKEVTSTCINHLQQGGSIGCNCYTESADHWRFRRAEVVALGEKRGFEVLTTEEEWEDECGGKCYCPKFKCPKCEEEVTSTCINHLQQGGSIGCRCNLTMARH